MAYGDYGAFVYRNGDRRPDKEDANIYDGWEQSSHGVLGDGAIRVACYKQGLPILFEILEGEIEPRRISIPGSDSEDFNNYEYSPFEFDYKGYHFHFESGECHGDERVSPFVAGMTEPDGTVWRCEYDYGFGSGFPEDERNTRGYYIPYR